MWYLFIVFVKDKAKAKHTLEWFKKNAYYYDAHYSAVSLMCSHERYLKIWIVFTWLQPNTLAEQVFPTIARAFLSYITYTLQAGAYDKLSTVLVNVYSETGEMLQCERILYQHLVERSCSLQAKSFFCLFILWSTVWIEIHLSLLNVFLHHFKFQCEKWHIYVLTHDLTHLATGVKVIVECENWSIENT